MSAIWKRILEQPTALLELVRQAVLWIMVMGWVHWTDTQQLQTIAMISAAIALANWALVTPTSKAVTAIAESAKTGVAQALTILLAVVMLATMAACSVSLKQKVVTAYGGTQVGLESVHDAERAMFEAKTIPSLSPNVQDKVLASLDKAFAAQQRAGAALLLWQPNEPIPASVMEWFDAADKLLPEIQAAAPEVADRLKVAGELVSWARALVQIAQLLHLTPPANVNQLAVVGAGSIL